MGLQDASALARASGFLPRPDKAWQARRARGRAAGISVEPSAPRICCGSGRVGAAAAAGRPKEVAAVGARPLARPPGEGSFFHGSL